MSIYAAAITKELERSAKKRAHLLPLISVTNEAGHIDPIHRADMIAFGPARPLYEGRNFKTQITLTKHGEHRALLVIETEDDIQSILEGAPTPVMRRVWEDALIELREREQKRLSGRINTLHTEQQTHIETQARIFKSSAGQEEIRPLRRQKEEIEKQQKERDFLPRLWARVSGTRENEDRTWKHLHDEIETKQAQALSRIEAKEARARTADIEALKEAKNALTAYWAGQNKPEWLTNELAQMEQAFTSLMKNWKDKAPKSPPRAPDDEDLLSTCQQMQQIELSAPDIEIDAQGYFDSEQSWTLAAVLAEDALRRQRRIDEDIDFDEQQRRLHAYLRQLEQERTIEYDGPGLSL